jgi:hypothetical protein
MEVTACTGYLGSDPIEQSGQFQEQVFLEDAEPLTPTLKIQPLWFPSAETFLVGKRLRREARFVSGSIVNRVQMSESAYLGANFIRFQPGFYNYAGKFMRRTKS